MSARPSGADGRRVLVAGGTSEIALAIVRALQEQTPREVALMGRDGQALERVAEQLRAEGCPRALVVELRALELGAPGASVHEAISRLGGADIAIVAIGVLGEGGVPDDLENAVEVLRVNFLGAGALLLHLVKAMREGGGGTLVVLSSVAAQRARRANPVYGASKAGLDALAQGLADALANEPVRVLVVRPGFVRTRMTDGMRAAPLATSAEAVATAVVRGLERGANTVWAPPALRWVMMLVQSLPRSVMRRIEQ